MPTLNLFIANIKIFYRNKAGFFWTLAMPLIIYAALCFLPVDRFLGQANVNYRSFLLPGLVAMSIMQGGIYGLAYWLVDLRARGVLKRFIVTPVTTWQFITGVLLSRIAVMYMQVIVLTVAGALLFGAELHPGILNILSILLFTFLGGGLFLLIGLVIATFAKSYESAAPITTGIGLPMTFLGNIFFPIEILPKSLQIVSKIMPMTYFAHGMRESFMGIHTVNQISTDLVVLILWFIALSLITLWRFKLDI